MSNVIEVRGISRDIMSRRVINGVQFEVGAGQCLGIAGDSGAGKTTLLRLLAGMIEPTEGELFVLQLNAKINGKGIRARVGMMPDRDGFEPDLSVLDALVAHGTLYGRSRHELKARARDLLRRVQLDEAESWPVHSLKKVHVRKLSLARALVHDPEVLFVDAPVRDLSGPDEKQIWALLREQKQRGMTMVVSSRDLDELEQLCDRVIILERGSIACQGRPETLIEQHIGKNVVEYEVAVQDVEYHLQALGGRFKYQLVGDKLKVFLPDTIDTQTAFRWVPSERVLYRRAKLKDVYVKLMGHDLNGGPS